MAADLILAIDQGTSATKAILVDSSGAVVAKSAVPVGEAHPRPGWVEQSADEIRDSVVVAVDTCLAQVPAGKAVAAGVSNQRESLVLWERASGIPAGPMISWQDQRTAEECRRLADANDAVYQISGLPLDPMFSALKAKWLLDRHDPDRSRSASGELCLGTVDSWLLSSPGGRHIVEAGNASRTQLMDIGRCAWDERLLKLFDVPLEVLPEIVPSTADFPVLPGISAPVLAVLADSHAALFAHAGWLPGQVKATYGTGSSVMGLAGAVDTTGGVCRTIAWDLDAPAYALEGNVRATGATLVWLAEVFGTTPEAIAEQATDAESQGVHIVPAFNGLGAPWWDTAAAGLVSGLSLSTGMPALAKAALESIAFQIEDVVAAVEAGTGRIETVLADGGPTTNSALMQLQADISGRQVQAAATSELSALGAAYLAGMRIGWWSLADLELLPRERTTYKPRGEPDWRAARLAGWHAAVGAARLVNAAC